MKIRKKWMFVTGFVLVAVIFGMYGLCRLDANMECWEDSVDSPADILDKSDYVALARLVRCTPVGEITYVERWGDTSHDRVYEFVYQTVSPLKGQWDSVAVWYAYSGHESLYKSETTLVYGLHMTNQTDISRKVWTSKGTELDMTDREAISQSTELMHRFDSLGGRLPVMFFSDRGNVYGEYENWGHLCYYDKDGTAHSVPSKSYWRQLERAAGDKK